MSSLKKWAARQYLVCAAIALALVVAVFPDVIFEGASLRMTDHMAAEYYGGKELRPFYPVPEHVKWWGAYNDTGGAAFQSEPMIEFMRRVMKTGDSPYWNPYAAGGAMGPESLVDMKFSVPTIVTALTGGSSLSYNVSALIYFVLGVYFLILTMTRVFELSKTAAIGAAVFFLIERIRCRQPGLQCGAELSFHSYMSLCSANARKDAECSPVRLGLSQLCVGVELHLCAHYHSEHHRGVCRSLGVSRASRSQS